MAILASQLQTEPATPPLLVLLQGPRELPDEPTAANRRGRSRGARNASCGPGRGNGGVHAPFRYQRRIGTLGPTPARDKQYRHRYQHALSILLMAGALRPIDMAVAGVMLDQTYGGTRDYRITESGLARRLPARTDGQAYSKGMASSALDRLRALGMIDWEHGTLEEFFDEVRRAMLDGRWQGPCKYRLMVPDELWQRVLIAEAEARTRTFAAKRAAQADKNAHRTQQANRPSRREEQRRQAESNAAALARMDTTVRFQDGLDKLHDAYGGDPDLYEYAYAQYSTTWQRTRGPS